MNRYQYISAGLVLCLCVCLGLGCSKKDNEKAAQNTENAVRKAYDKITGVLKDVVEGINDAVYK